MNQVSLSTLLKALDALDAAREALLVSNAPQEVYFQTLTAGTELRLALRPPQPITNPLADVPEFLAGAI